MATIEQIREENNDEKTKDNSIVINFNFDDKDINKEIDEYSYNYNLKHKQDNSGDLSTNDLYKIEKDVIELSEVFNTVQEMVLEQKECIDTIQNNIDVTSEYVIIAQDDLDEIEKIKKGIENKKTILYSFGAIVIAIPISVLAGPGAGVSFAILGVMGIKGYSFFKKNTTIQN